jgi:hypothetical protein
MKGKHKIVIQLLVFMLGMTLISLSACENGSYPPDGPYSGTGFIAFSVVWKGGPANFKA